MRVNLVLIIFASLFLAFSSQNCSRRVIMESGSIHTVAHHAVDRDFTRMVYTANNLPAGSLEKSITLNYDLLNHHVEIASVRADGLRCTKTFSISPVLTEAFQSTFHSMSYAPDIEPPHLFAGDNYMTLSSPQGQQDFVIDAAVVPAHVAQVKDPQALYYLIQGLFYSDDSGSVENCM